LPRWRSNLTHREDCREALHGTGHRIVVLDRDADIDVDLSSEASTRAAAAAVLGVMRTLALTLGPAGIAVSAVAPGLTDTPASRTVNTDEQFDATVHRQALKRRLTPDDTAAAVTYLASDAAAAMTGQVLCADGGLIMR